MIFQNIVSNLFHVGMTVPFVALFIEYLNPLLLITVRMDQTIDKDTLLLQNQQQDFDYIIVGAGSAGCILASRLSEDAGVRILLLEAGGIPSPILNFPTIAFPLNGQDAFNWARRTVPQRHAAFGLGNKLSFWPSGKGLGGSTLINGLINIRGNVQGYDRIANRTGDSMWSMSNILKFYNKVENYDGWFSKDTHGRSGDLKINVPTLIPGAKYFLKAGMELGYKIRDPNANGPHSQGFSPVESYLDDGFRADVYHSTLRRVMDRPNLVVRKYSFVTKLMFDDLQNTVIGVEYERHGQVYVANAKKETILSAGALGSPQILMLSGIGPRRHLEEVGLPVRLNLPVGQRLQDKYGALVGPFIVDDGYSFDQFRDVNVTTWYGWLLQRKGILTSGRTEACAAILTDRAKAVGDIWSPDVHIYLLSQTPVKPEVPFKTSFNLNVASINYLKQVKGDAFFQLVTASRSIGTGTVRLQNKNPRVPLLIDPKYLENANDLQTVVQGIKFAVKVFEETKAMQSIGSKLYRKPIPGCEGYEFKSDPYYECLARHWTLTAYKYCGTIPLGHPNDPEAVVDSRFRVFGIQKLRVIDSSLLRINEVNTNDVTMRMLGELGAHVIKQANQS